MSITNTQLDGLIQRAEQTAITKAMRGKWSEADAAHLSDLYVERHRREGRSHE